MTPDPTSLAAFLLERVSEDEADPWRGAEMIGADRIVGADEARALAEGERKWEARVLAQCEAFRRIVELHMSSVSRECTSAGTR